MTNYIKKTYQKIKRIFSKKTPEQRGYNGRPLDDWVISKKDLKRIVKAAGISDDETISAKALRLVRKRKLAEEIKKIENDPHQMEELEKLAYLAALEELQRHKRAVQMTVIMEEKTKKAIGEIDKMEIKWKDYLSENNVEKPNAKLFGKFLVNRRYLTKKQLKEVEVAAIFVDDRIVNPSNFHSELSRVKQA